MNILIAPDKFKDSLSAKEVCEAIHKGLVLQHPLATILHHPMADGGEGSLTILKDLLNLTRHTCSTTDPLGRAMEAHYYTDTHHAYIELASASGLTLLTPEERNPIQTSTLGTGRLVADAISKGFRHIYLFIGGSATNDAGTGIAHALGFRFLDKNQQILLPIGQNLSKIESIQLPKTDFSNLDLTILCDVKNPLYGANGAAHTYAPQKGANPKQVQLLDDGLRHFAFVLEQKTAKSIATLEGMGAAGGVAASLVGLMGANVQHGFSILAQLTDLETKIQTADIVISGEGKLDQQSLQGKVISGIAQLCKRNNKPLYLLVGKNDMKGKTQTLEIKDILEIIHFAQNPKDAMRNASHYLTKMASELSFDRDLVHPL